MFQDSDKNQIHQKGQEIFAGDSDEEFQDLSHFE